MASTPAAVRPPSAPDRRPALPVVAPPAALPAIARTASQQLQQRLGNQGTQALMARMSLSTTLDVTATTTASAAPATTGAAGTAVAATAVTMDGGGAATSAAEAAPKAEAKEGAGPAPATTEKPAAKAGAPDAAAGPDGAAGAAGSDGAAKAEKKAAARPNPRAAIAPAAGAIRKRAAAARNVTPAPIAVASAQAAAITPSIEQQRGASKETVTNLDAAKAEEIRREAFKTKLKQAIDAATPKPKSESEAERVMKTGADQANAQMRGQLATEQDAAAGPLKSAQAAQASPSDQPTEPKSDLKPDQVGPPPTPVSAAAMVPAPLPAEQLDYSEDRAPTDQAMAQNNVTKEQMQKGNDPAFGPTIEARGTAEKHEATAEAKYRQSEDKVQDQTKTAAQQALGKELGSIHGARALGIGKVIGHQVGTLGKNAAERKRITETVTGIKDRARSDVELTLKRMETEAGTIFEAGLKKAETSYEQVFEDAKGGVGTWLTTWGDDWEKLIENSLAKARVEYLRQVDIAIDQVADFVEAQLKAAKTRVAQGRKEVDDFVKGLDASVLQFGKDALAAVSTDFDAMGTEIDQRRDGLIDKLTEQYKASYERMAATEEKLREANKSLWQRVYDATIGLIKKILAFKDMLLGILSKAAGVISDIISDPIGFLGNLVSAVMLGMKNFKANIGKHLQKGLMDWLFGALAAGGLQLPDAFDLKGIVSIVLQVLGLTYANFRKRAVAIVGEPIVGALEQTAEVFKVLLTEGIPGLWRFIKDKLADLKTMVLDAIFEYIKEKVIVAGIMWIIGLLNPASAFFKACKAIYDIVMFFIERGSQIMELVNAIVDSMAAIAKGSIGAAASWIENALAKSIPVAIGFLASLLGLGDVSKTTRNTMEKAQTPVNSAMDWVINQAVKLVKAAGKLITGAFGKKDKKDNVKETNDPQHDAKVTAGLASIEIEEKKYIVNGELAREDAEKVAATVKQNHPIFKSIVVKEGGGKWKYHYTASEGDATGAVQATFCIVSVKDIIEKKVTTPSALPYEPTSKNVMEAAVDDPLAPQMLEKEVAATIAESLEVTNPAYKTKSKYPAKAQKPFGLPVTPVMLREPKTNLGGGRVAKDRYWRPDIVVLMPDRVEAVEVTLDANFRIPEGGKYATVGAPPHKRVQIAGTVFALANKYRDKGKEGKKVPIIYTIRATREPSKDAITHINNELKALIKSGIDVQIIWVWG